LRGPLKSLDDLRLLPEFTAHDLERLKPYVAF
jgi:type II secretory pathway component PulK